MDRFAHFQSFKFRIPLVFFYHLANEFCFDYIILLKHWFHGEHQVPGHSTTEACTILETSPILMNRLSRLSGRLYQLSMMIT